MSAVYYERIERYGVCLHVPLTAESLHEARKMLALKGHEAKAVRLHPVDWCHLWDSMSTDMLFEINDRGNQLRWRGLLFDRDETIPEGAWIVQTADTETILPVR